MKRFLIFSVIIGFVLSFISYAGAETSSTDFYKVGVDDMLEIKVLDHKDLRTLATVTSDGTISFPYIGTVNVKDMSLSEIEAMITNKLAEGYIKYPVVTVSLVKSMSRKIFAYGELYKRGEIPLEENVTLLKALSLAGGVTENGRYGMVKVRRKKEGKPGYRDIKVDIKQVIEGGGKGDILLEPDDILIVERSKTFFAHGEVGKPGEHVLEKNMSLVRALSAVGGIRSEGLYGKVKIRRKQKGKRGYKDIEIDLKAIVEGSKAKDMLLQPDDILIVERNKTFLIQGEVKNRGRLILEEDMTVLRALLQAGGVSEDGMYGRIKIRRKQAGGSGEYKDIVETRLNDGVIESSEVEDTLLQPDDILIVERNKTFLIQGEVMKRGRFVLEKDMTVLRALLQAGGVSKDGMYGRIKIRRKQAGGSGEYKDIVETRLNNGVIESSEVEDTLLQPDDVLVIEPNEKFLVYGEILKPGEYVIKNDMTAFKAITLAGGFTKWGSENRVKVLRSRKNNAGFETIRVNIDDVIDGDAAADIALEAGDIVVVSAGVF
ncbi:MAG TPA: hypothetical protein ENH01_05810 [Nitrospirae bacterium]|nr:hypothetical protein [Nitrospirota bacterium]